MLSIKLQCLLILVISILCKFSIGFKCNAKPNLNRRFDTLLFVQQWPVTYCKSWTKEGKECKTPPQQGIWTIHGIWPSRFSTSVADQPSCCDSSIDFKVDQLQPIKELLTRNWPSVQRDKPDESFWEYEWMKHGTCSVNIVGMDTSLKFFNQALYWLKQYDMTAILAKAEIFPDNEKAYRLIDIHQAVKKSTTRNPSISCYIDDQTGEQYLKEIRICFDRELGIIDCDGIDRKMSKDNVSSNCINKPINYPVDFADSTTGWFTYLAIFGLLLFLIFIALFARSSRLRDRLMGNAELSRLFNR